ncbi:HDOD domain-containing protein [uncultured Variovorax sp.]|jgi:hypothetical protein|uniref:HDOD domain-containing protein n=1 Tax=uncultured Variovorax sp. TaxID=114708 RepID=UPI0026386A19|nr:HDOD domain-containing protein [uncultured Variovorax sp.]
MTIDELLQQGRALPSIPKVVQELIQGLSKDDVLTGEIARQLATDQVLSAKVLRLANSAYYNVSRTVGTVDEALKLLGWTRFTASFTLPPGCPELKKPSSTRRSAPKTSPKPWPTRSTCRPCMTLLQPCRRWPNSAPGLRT